MKTSADYQRAYRERLKNKIGEEEYKRLDAKKARDKRHARGLKKSGPRPGKMLLDREGIISRFREIHQDRYEYPGVYAGMHTPMEMLCSIHGAFTSRPGNHLKGAGCVACGITDRAAKKLLDNQEFVSRSLAVHGLRYDYSGSVYTGRKGGVEITCRKHGVFTQAAETHWLGNGCSKCGVSTSNAETEVYDFCASFVPAEQGIRGLLKNKRLQLDIFIPSKSLAIEYCGLYWHSNKIKKYQDNRRHLEKHNQCLDSGIRLITLFEDEWLYRRPAIENLLRSGLGVNPKIQARKCSISREVDSNSFYEMFHAQGKPRGGQDFALVLDGVVVACMTFSRSLSHRGRKGGWELVRYASNGSVVGGASRLFTAFIREYNPERIVSYSDNRFFSGAMYGCLGFSLDHETGPDYRVVDTRRVKSFHKSKFRRSSIPKIIKEYSLQDHFDPKTDPRSEFDFCEQHGFGRIYDCGKKCWVWTSGQI